MGFAESLTPEEIRAAEEILRNQTPDLQALAVRLRLPPERAFRLIPMAFSVGELSGKWSVYSVHLVGIVHAWTEPPYPCVCSFVVGSGRGRNVLEVVELVAGVPGFLARLEARWHEDGTEEIRLVGLHVQPAARTGQARLLKVLGLLSGVTRTAKATETRSYRHHVMRRRAGELKLRGMTIRAIAKELRRSERHIYSLLAETKSLKDG